MKTITTHNPCYHHIKGVKKYPQMHGHGKENTHIHMERLGHH